MTKIPPNDTREIGLVDFSQEAIKKAVTSQVMQSPAFLYPSAFGVLSGMALLVFGVSLPLAGIAAAGLGIGAAGVVWQLGFRREKLARDYLNRMHETLNAQRHQLVGDLTNRMLQVQFTQGVRQLEQLQKKFQNFVGILNLTLDKEEITYGRYLGIAEQVYLSSRDNLERAVGALASVQTIDPHVIQERIREIHTDGVVTDTEATEKESLSQRRALRENQHEKVAKLIAQNEQALTQLDLTAAALAEMKTRSGQASMDMETAMAELQDLIEKAPKYNRKN